MFGTSCDTWGTETVSRAFIAVSLGIRARGSARTHDMGQFFYFLDVIHAHVEGARVDVITLPDQIIESGEILLQTFHSDDSE